MAAEFILPVMLIRQLRPRFVAVAAHMVFCKTITRIIFWALTHPIPGAEGRICVTAVSPFSTVPAYTRSSIKSFAYACSHIFKIMHTNGRDVR